ncbi:MAG: hypothetical protein RRB12_09585 [Armatimonadota bacterium]|nr:hypothetical protein [Armatimonadota bacterium]
MKQQRLKLGMLLYLFFNLLILILLKLFIINPFWKEFIDGAFKGTIISTFAWLYSIYRKLYKFTE